MSSNAACVIGASVFVKKCRCSDCFVLETKTLCVLGRWPTICLFSFSVTLIKEPTSVEHRLSKKIKISFDVHIC